MKSNACFPAAFKYELYALANKDFHYLTKSYLARKLKEKDRWTSRSGQRGVLMRS
jgi:hypothetical protein